MDIMTLIILEIKLFILMNVNYDYWVELANQFNFTKEQVKK